MYPTTRDFVAALDRAGELRRIRQSVGPVLEVSAIADQVSKSRCARLPSAAAQRTDPHHHAKGGHALLFESPTGSDFPLLINAWGSYSRMEMALGCEATGFEAIANRIADLVKPQPPRSLGELFSLLKRLKPLLTIPPKRKRGSGLCQQVVLTGDRIDLTRLPLIRCWPLDGDLASVGYPADVNDRVEGLGRGTDWERDFRGRYITLGGVHTVHADDRDDPKPASHNIGMYRAQLLAKDKLAMHWHMHHDGARHWRSWKALGQPMPVAIALGGESVMPYAATAPLPPGLSELLLAGYLNGSGIPLVRAKTVPLWIPANAEIIIEGFVSHESGGIGWDPRDPNAGPLGAGAVFEGPFGDHTGFYSMPDRYPVLSVTAITHRRDAIYPTTIVGLPPQEDYYLGKATERIFLPLLRTLIPDIEDYDLPLFGAFHNCAFVKIKKHYPLHARRVMHSIWGAGQMAWTKNIFVVDDDIEVHDAPAVLAAAAAHCKPARDIERANGPLDILDHAAPRLGAGMKLGFDCTRKIGGENIDGEPLPPAMISHQHAGFERPGGSPGCSHGWSEPPSATRGNDAPLGPRPGGATESSAITSLLATIRSLPPILDAALIANGWLLVRATKSAPGDGRRVMEQVAALLPSGPAACRIPFLIVLGPDADLTNPPFPDLAFFHALANADASRDAAIIRGTWCVDATPKLPGDERNNQPVRPWPPLIRMDEAITARTRAMVAHA